MKYLNAETRKEIATILAGEHDRWIQYRDKQPKHERPAINIRRGVAEGKVSHLRQLIAALYPKLLK